jgi:hypothetical protein
MKTTPVLTLVVALLTSGRDCLAQAPAELNQIDVSASVSIPETLPVTEMLATLQRPDGAPSDPVDDLCFGAQPAPTCRSFAVTTFGVLIGLKRVGWGVVDGQKNVQTARLITDLGVMRNLGSRHAMGASWFFTLDDYGWSAGPTVRYRRWLNSRRSLDLGVGMPVVASGTSFYSAVSGPARGSILGLVKYNPAPWFGVAVRPEIVRHTDCDVPAVGCGDRPPLRTVTTSRVLAGIELSEKPGATLNVIWWGATGLITLLLAATGGG